MKKLLMSCIICLCAGVAMGQTPIAKGIGKAASGVVREVPVGFPIGTDASLIAPFAGSEKAMDEFEKASAAIENLLPSQRALLDVRGAAIHLGAESFGLKPRRAIEMEIANLGFLATENASIAERASQLREKILSVQSNASHIEQELGNAIKPAHGESMAHFAVSQLPENLKYLCIAEEGAITTEGLATIEQLITEIRAKFPARKIILITSFLPKRKVWFPVSSSRTVFPGNHGQIWQSALDNGMAVMGADKSQGMPEAYYANLQSQEMEEVTASTSQTVMGQNLQREQFVSLIADFHKLNKPDLIDNVLFILHGRPVNMLYDEFASVADVLAKSSPDIRVIHLAPDVGVNESGNPTHKTTKFENIVPPGLGMSLSSVSAMAWNSNASKIIRQMSGTDIRLKVK